MMRPEEYTVKLDVDGETQTVPLRVELNPGVKTSSADLQQQFDLATKVSDRISETHETVNSMRELRKQIEALEDRNLAVQDKSRSLALPKPSIKRLWRWKLPSSRSKRLQKRILSTTAEG